MEEVIKKETDENGSVIKEELGVKRILDPVLLEEIIQYTEDMNADRIVAAELAIAQAMKMDPIMGAVQEERKSIYPKKTKSKLFSRNSQMFTNRKSKLFS